MATGWLWEERYAWFDAGTWNEVLKHLGRIPTSKVNCFEAKGCKRIARIFPFRGARLEKSNRVGAVYDDTAVPVRQAD